MSIPHSCAMTTDGGPIHAPTTSRERPPISVGVVDDHPPILASLVAAVGAEPDMVLVGSARTVEDAIRLASLVDVLVCDVQLEGHAEGLAILADIQRPQTTNQSGPPAVILLSGFAQPSLIRAAIDRGAAGFLSKGAELPEIMAAIRTVAAGGTVYTSEALRLSRDARRRPSPRELQVIDLIAGGATNAEAAVALDLSEKTIESHLRRLFDRYGSVSRTELAVLAIAEGWSSEPPARP